MWAPHLTENPKLLQRCQNKSRCNSPLLQSASRHVWEWLFFLSSSNPKMIILCEEIGNYQIFIKRALTYTLCILELAGDFLPESIFRKTYDFHKICMKDFLEIFFFFFLDQFNLYFTFVSFSGCLNSRNCFSLCKYHLLCNWSEMDVIKKPNKPHFDNSSTKLIVITMKVIFFLPLFPDYWLILAQ